MGSLLKAYSEQKLKGKIYTPPFIIQKMLDDVGCLNASLLGKKIIDPACGNGRFLLEIARRVIQYSPPEQLESNLNQIYGWDLDEEAIDKCYQNLEKLVAPYALAVDWKLSVRDSLEEISQTNYHAYFDFIVGNPPYVRIQHLEETTRDFLQNHFQFCQSGATDLFIAFFELAYHLLAPHGKCAFITPNSFLYSETAKAMRQDFAQKQCVDRISNYGEIRLFERVGTYSAISVISKQAQSRLYYEKALCPKSFEARNIDYEEIKAQKAWRLSAKSPPKIGGATLKEIVNIHVGLTTLQDKSYIFQTEALDKNHIWACTKWGRFKMEKQILRPILKGSKVKNAQEPIHEYILFPYHWQDDKHQIIPESLLGEIYPFAYQYLLQIKDQLDKRDNGRLNPSAWYAFGRHQSLNTSFGKKIIFSPMNKEPNFIFHENEEATLYSGYFMKLKENPTPERYQKLLEQLNSPAMADYVAVSSRDFRGGWKAYSKRVVEDFPIDTSKL